MLWNMEEKLYHCRHILYNITKWTNQPTNQPIPWSMVISEKLTGPQLVTKFRELYSTQKLIITYLSN